MTKTNEPRLRFNGFNKELEKVKYSDVFDSFQYGLNKSGITFDGINKYLRITDIDDETRNFNKNKLVSPNITNKEDYESYILMKNDILFARTGASTGKTYLYKETDGKVYYAGFLIKGHVKNKFDSHFIFFNTLTSYFRNFVKIMSIRSGQPGINSNEYSKYELYVPNLYEQQKIGEFFAKQDKLIELQTQKVDQLKKLKRGYLQKMFPQEGETVPRLRFSGFSGEWKEEKANDIFINESIKNHGYEEVLAATQDNGIVYRKDLDIDIKFDKTTLNKYKYVIPGNIIISLRSFQGGFEVSNKKGIISPAYTIMSFKDSENNINYWKQYLKTYKFIQSLKKVTFGIRDGRSISFKEFSTLKLKFTENKNEQQKIGDFFAKLDKLIEEQSVKLDQLKQQKKAYLQKMFI